MKKITIISNQSVFDVAIQAFGSVNAAFDLAFANNLSITSDLQPGQTLIIPESLFLNQDVKNYFLGKQRKIATHIALPNSGELSPVLGGIGYMGIEIDFIVS